MGVVVEVFADVACPFTHVGLRRFVRYRHEQGRRHPTLRVRAWPLELVNGVALDGPSLIPKVEALRARVAPDLFMGFDALTFPGSTLAAMEAEAAAYAAGDDIGEAFSLAIRDALFEHGRDVSNPAIQDELLHDHGVVPPAVGSLGAVERDFSEGRRRHVAGSPHFFTPTGDFFCPSLDIAHDDDGYEIAFDDEGFQRFVAAAFS